MLPDGTKIKAGGMVTYVPYSMGRMEYNWGPNAASFNPERWFHDGVLKNESPFKFTAFQVNKLVKIEYYVLHKKSITIHKHNKKKITSLSPNNSQTL